MKTKIKKGDVILCKSVFPTQEDLVINVETFGNGKIVDKNGTEYSIEDLKKIYKSFRAMR